MHGLRNAHGPSAGPRPGHLGVVLAAKLVLAIALLTLVPYWAGLLSWVVAGHAALAVLLLGLGAVLLFRRGIATRLTSHAVDRFKDAGMSIVMVETGGDPGHAPARRTYEASGFRLLPVARYFKSLRT